MKSRLMIISLLTLFLFNSVIINSTDVYARSKAKKTVKKSTAKKVSKGKIKISAKGQKKRWASRRVVARQRAAAYRRAMLARAHKVDLSLLRVTQEHILDDDPTGEDQEMRRIALEALGNTPGTVVLMHPKTGRVYTMVNQKWAIGKPVKPCSTIKLVTSLAALSENIVDPDLPLDISGGADNINMIDALARSNNEYFQELGEEMGFELVMNYAREWGLGEITGINLDGESPGFLPSYKNPRAVPHMCSHGDDIGVTAIQLAVLTAAIANGGYIYQPQILRTEKELREFQPILLRKVDIEEKDRLKIIEGMLGAVSYGTAKRSAVATLNVAGKTGSCTGAESKLGLFASFTNPENPELVVVVIATGSSQRGSLSAMIAGEVYSRLSERFGKGQRPRRVNPVLEESSSSSND